jgi:hypothetical protein
MSQDFSSIDEVRAYLGQFVDSINFTRKGHDQSLGRDVVMTVILGPNLDGQGGIAGRCAAGVTPDGQEWPPNSDNPWPPENPVFPGYATWKEQKYGWREVGRRTGQTLSQVSLYGRTTIEPEQVTMIYGTDQPPDQSYSPNKYISESDKETSDVEKGTYLTQQGRSFYGLATSDAENVAAVCQVAINDAITEANQ